jgi:hypothetical protein
VGSVELNEFLACKTMVSAKLYAGRLVLVGTAGRYNRYDVEGERGRGYAHRLFDRSEAVEMPTDHDDTLFGSVPATDLRASLVNAEVLLAGTILAQGGGL